jgi:hypothetical protein
VAQSDQLTAGLIRKGLARGGDPDAPVRRESDSESPAMSRAERVPLPTRPPPAPTGRKPLGARIPDDLHERLTVISFYTRTTIQELVTRMLQGGVDSMEREIRRQRGEEP